MTKKTNATNTGNTYGIDVFRGYYDSYISALRTGDIKSADKSCSNARVFFNKAASSLDTLVDRCADTLSLVGCLDPLTNAPFDSADITDLDSRLKSSIKAIIDTRKDLINSGCKFFGKLSNIMNDLHYYRDSYLISYGKRIISDASDLLAILPSTIDGLDGIKAASGIVDNIAIRDLIPKTIYVNDSDNYGRSCDA